MSFAHAEERHCSLIEDHSNRLSCYTANTIPNHKNWLVAKSNHNNSISISRSAIYPVMCGDKIGSNTMVLTCSDMKTDILLSTSCVMGASNEKSNVLIQIDDQESKPIVFSVPNNQYSLSLNDSKAAIEVTKSFLGKEQVHMRIFPPLFEPYTATFNVSDLEGAVAPLREFCGW